MVSRFQPDAFVIQCGADCLTGDPLGGFNLTPEGMAQCVDFEKEIIEFADEQLAS